jgi:hypothetical protein
VEQSPAQYRKFADECRRLAKFVQTADKRKVLQEMAAAWTKVAEEVEGKAGKNGNLILWMVIAAGACLFSLCEGKSHSRHLSALPTSPIPRLAMQPAGAHTMACFECC